MRRCVVGVAAVIAALVVTVPAWADYSAGQKAWEAGRFAEAVSEWETAAAEGDRWAMVALGHVYKRGVGAPQDYILAHLWFNLAASQGDVQAAAERDALAEQMSLEEQAEARKLLREWRRKLRTTVEVDEPASAPSEAESDTGSPPPRAIKEAQSLLTQLGYAPGLADGIWGRRTAEAYQAFLRDAGLPTADMLTPKALHAMRETVANQGQVETTRSDRGGPTGGRTAPGGEGGRSRWTEDRPRDWGGCERAGRPRLDGADARGEQGLYAVGFAAAEGEGGSRRSGSGRRDGFYLWRQCMAIQRSSHY